MCILRSPSVIEIRVDCVRLPTAALGTGGTFMKWHQKFSVLLFAGLAALSGHAQTTEKYLAPRDQLVAIRAGRLFDARSGTMLSNQVVIVRGDRIAEVGSGLAIPSGANVIDLSNATVMPGMIDADEHIHTVGDTEA